MLELVAFIQSQGVRVWTVKQEQRNPCLRMARPRVHFIWIPTSPDGMDLWRHPLHCAFLLHLGQMLTPDHRGARACMHPDCTLQAGLLRRHLPDHSDPFINSLAQVTEVLPHLVLGDRLT